MKCKFCNLNKESILFETETSYVLEGSSSHHGHIIVAYKKHKTSILGLKTEDFMKFARDLHKVAVIVKKSFNADKLNLALFGNWEPHLHWHIYPRYVGDLDFGQPPLLQWKIMKRRVFPPKIKLKKKPLTLKEKKEFIKELEKEFS